MPMFKKNINTKKVTLQTILWIFWTNSLGKIEKSDLILRQCSQASEERSEAQSSETHMTFLFLWPTSSSFNGRPPSRTRLNNIIAAAGRVSCLIFGEDLNFQNPWNSRKRLFQTSTLQLWLCLLLRPFWLSFNVFF